MKKKSPPTPLYQRGAIHEGFVLMETLLSLGLAMGVLVMLLPAFSNLMQMEKRLHQERDALLACREQVITAETEPLSSLSTHSDFRLSPQGDKIAVEIMNPEVEGLVVLR